MTEITPGAGELRVTSGDAIVAVIENWQARRRQVAAIAAASGMVAPTLPYHTLLLDTAKVFLARGEYQVAVVISQTAVEVLVEQIITDQVRKRNTAPELEEWIMNRAKPFGLTGSASFDLYVTLTNDKIQRAPFWDEYRRHVTRRHGVVHRGQEVSRLLGEESVAIADQIIRHLEDRKG